MSKKCIHFDFLFFFILQAAYEKLPRSKQIVVVISTAHFCWHKWSTKHPISYSLHSVGEISYPHRSLFSVNYFSKQDVSDLNCISSSFCLHCDSHSTDNCMDHITNLFVYLSSFNGTVGSQKSWSLWPVFLL